MQFYDNCIDITKLNNSTAWKSHISAEIKNFKKKYNICGHDKNLK